MSGLGKFWRVVFCAILMAFVAGSPFPADAQRRDNHPGCATLDEFEFAEMAEELFTRIFSDQNFVDATANGRPSVVIGDLSNDSHSYRLEPDVMFNQLRNILIRSQAVRLFAPGADFPDLTMAAQLTSTYERGRGGAQSSAYTLNITLTKLNGEYLGAWSVSRSC
ncbi:MAG: hypothetical protein KF779_11745 [Hyphomonadaceae bacterium]|nr:hypothetical protein [Hyphomonadaceae bacterium]